MRAQLFNVALVLPIALGFLGSAAAEEAPALPEEELRNLVDGYAHAIEVNNLELALAYLHPLSPSRREIETALRDQLASYLERSRTSSLAMEQLSDGTLAARVDQEVVRVTGIKVLHAARRSLYRFRRLGASWRIWAIEAVEGRRSAPTRPPRRGRRG